MFVGKCSTRSFYERSHKIGPFMSVVVCKHKRIKGRVAETICRVMLLLFAVAKLQTAFCDGGLLLARVVPESLATGKMAR